MEWFKYVLIFHFLCKVCSVSMQAKSEVPAVARWLSMEGGMKKRLSVGVGFEGCLKVITVGESLVSKDELFRCRMLSSRRLLLECSGNA